MPGSNAMTGIMFDGFPIMFMMVFILILGTFVFMMVKNIAQWNKNNHSPRLTVEARVVGKRDQVSRHHHNHDNHHHTSTSTTYYVTFQFESGDRLELQVRNNEYGYLIEGDKGTLTFQGTRYLGFEQQAQQL